VLRTYGPLARVYYLIQEKIVDPVERKKVWRLKRTDDEKEQDKATVRARRKQKLANVTEEELKAFRAKESAQTMLAEKRRKARMTEGEREEAQEKNWIAQRNQRQKQKAAKK
jgi:hypothetical protein